MLKILNTVILNKKEVEQVLKYCINLSKVLVLLNSAAQDTEKYRELMSFIYKLEDLADK